MLDNDIELAARELCKLRGEDPDECVITGGTYGQAVARHPPRWRLAAAEIKRHLEIERAIKNAKAIAYNQT